jgi:catechol 2,3-dioxygenase-like lactoylglutathione lyase family enzyme
MPITDAPVHPTLAVSDIERSRRWYADKLGWEPMAGVPFEDPLIYRVGDSGFSLYTTPSAGTAKNTVMNWTVDDVTAKVAELRARGLAFEEYDFGEIKTVEGVMTVEGDYKNAWFKDPDGNIIGLVSGPDGIPGMPNGSLTPMLAASDLERAKAWYASKLGFEPVYENPGVVVTYASGGTPFTIYATQFAGTAKNTVAVWRLPNMRAEVERLKGRGIEFPDFDFGDGDKSVDGIMSDDTGDLQAWFQDSEGNWLAIAEDRPELDLPG